MIQFGNGLRGRGWSRDVLERTGGCRGGGQTWLPQQLLMIGEAVAGGGWVGGEGSGGHKIVGGLREPKRLERNGWLSPPPRSRQCPGQSAACKTKKGKASSGRPGSIQRPLCAFVG